ncbi:hypothetical protein LSAT2_030335 [Lamellibrachia satsuma]|nr:hypothetical protein LSAT2_030335 [Lamellibrachia satsuma]
MSTRQRQANIMGELEHESGVTCCDVSCDGSQVAAGTAEGDVCLWDVSTCYLLRHQHAHTGTVHAVAFSPDAQQLISCGEDGYLQVIDVNTGTEIFSKSAGQDLRCAQWDGQTVLVGCGAGNLLVCDLVSLHMESIAQVYTGAVTSLDLCPNGKLATGGMERTVKVWKVT